MSQSRVIISLLVFSLLMSSVAGGSSVVGVVQNCENKAVPGSTNWSIGSNMYLANVTLHSLDSSSILSCGNDSFYESGPNPQVIWRIRVIVNWTSSPSNASLSLLTWRLTTPVGVCKLSINQTNQSEINGQADDCSLSFNLIGINNMTVELQVVNNDTSDVTISISTMKIVVELIDPVVEVPSPQFLSNGSQLAITTTSSLSSNIKVAVAFVDTQFDLHLNVVSYFNQSNSANVSNIFLSESRERNPQLARLGNQYIAMASVTGNNEIMFRIFDVFNYLIVNSSKFSQNVREVKIAATNSSTVLICWSTQWSTFTAQCQIIENFTPRSIFSLYENFSSFAIAGSSTSEKFLVVYLSPNGTLQGAYITRGGQGWSPPNSFPVVSSASIQSFAVASFQMDDFILVFANNSGLYATKISTSQTIPLSIWPGFRQQINQISLVGLPDERFVVAITNSSSDRSLFVVFNFRIGLIGSLAFESSRNPVITLVNTQSSFSPNNTLVFGMAMEGNGNITVQLIALFPFCGDGIVNNDEECDQQQNCYNYTCLFVSQPTPEQSISTSSSLSSSSGSTTPQSDNSNLTSTSGPSDNNNNNTNLAIGLGVGGAILVGSGVLLFVLLWRRRQKKRRKNASENGVEEEKFDSEKEKTTALIVPEEKGEVKWDAHYVNYDVDKNRTLREKYAATNEKTDLPNSLGEDDRLHIPYKELKFKQEIGAGSFGKVYVGEWQATKVAIKVSNTAAGGEDFRREATLMVNIRPHPNVLTVLGVSTDGPNIAIIMEFCGGGSLDRILFNNKIEISEAYRWRLIAGIARGMYHLHRNNIIHRDLAARNILLSSDGEPKISDFGMSRIVNEWVKKGTTKTNIGPIRWMAPESLASQVYSTKSDVWSFGIVIYEIVARQEPHIDISILDVGPLIRDKKLTPKLPPDVDPVITELTSLCWKPNPEDRPEFDELCERIAQIIESKNL